MKYKTLRVIGVIVMCFCIFQLGKIMERRSYYKRMIECAKGPGHQSLQEFYGHDFKTLTHTIWNHAKAHNSNIYLNCVWKDLFKR